MSDIEEEKKEHVKKYRKQQPKELKKPKHTHTHTHTHKKNSL